MEYQPKLNEKYTLFLYGIWRFEVTSYKHLKINHQIFYFLLFYIRFTSAGIHKLLELHSALSGKKIFVTNFPFLMASLNPLHPLNGQNPLSMTKGFCWYSLTNFSNVTSICPKYYCTQLSCHVSKKVAEELSFSELKIGKVNFFYSESNTKIFCINDLTLEVA